MGEREKGSPCYNVWVNLIRVGCRVGSPWKESNLVVFELVNVARRVTITSGKLYLIFESSSFKFNKNIGR